MNQISDRPSRTDLVARELAFRAQDGLEVTLYWNELDNQLTVVVLDHKIEDAFVIRVQDEPPLDVFHHPFAYAARRVRTTARHSDRPTAISRCDRSLRPGGQ
jgi:hypothetical protein